MGRQRRWTFLSNHAHVLVALAKNAKITVREIADAVGITERAVAQILTDLEEARVLKRWRDGRRNVYDIDLNAHLRHDIESHRTVADIVRLAAPLSVSPAKGYADSNRLKNSR